MKRIIDHFLLQWKQDDDRRPLLMRGARQVGKTYSVRQLGTSYPDFVEINLEQQADAPRIFEGDLDPAVICRELSLIAKKPIVPGKTLLFLDEIQMVPRAITALRYFYEMLPELHIIAAGSLLDFAIEQVGIPVGRVQSMYMHPLSFIEYLAADGNGLFINEIINHTPEKDISPMIHNKLLGLLGEYLALGGVPNSVQRWVDKKDPLGCAKIHSRLLSTYRQDFAKYARKLQIKYVELLFEHIPMQLGRKFKYSLIEGDYRKRELAPALDLLVTAGIAHKVYYSAGQGVPLGAQIDPQDYKVIFLDAGLAQSLLDLDIAQWFLNPQNEIINKGALVEAFVGQELLVYADPQIKNNIYYWHKDAAIGQSEVDYLIQIGASVVPVEVKSGSGRTLKSIQTFLDSHVKSPYGIRFSSQNYSVYDKIYSYPLYAVAKVMSDKNPEIKQAISKLV
ncbi:MAG: ATP-binding protein [bacterium]